MPILALRVLPIFDVMAVSSLMVKPGSAVSDSPSASTDGRAVALIVFHALKKFGGRELREIVDKSSEEKTAPRAVFKHRPFVAENQSCM